MVLKRRFSFWWRIFVPIVLLSWLIVIFLMSYFYNHETNMRERTIVQQLDLLSSRIIAVYEQRNTNEDHDLGEFIRTLGIFFEDSRYDGVRISVFEKDDFDNGKTPRYYLGAPIDKEFVARQLNKKSDDNYEGQASSTTGELYYFKSAKSNDGKLLIYTAMPLTATLRESLSTTEVTFWSILIVLLAASALTAYFITRNITNNIRILRDFANNANNNNVQFDESKFPHNELGDISRQIVKLYRDRTNALEKSQREHNVAIHAVEEKARIKRQMTNNINHELKTPVGVIKGYLDTVLSSDDMDDKTRTYFLRRAQQNVDRLCNLLNDVATMTRLEEGSGNIPVTTINFHDIVYSIDNDFSTAGLTGDMTFEYDVPLDCEVLGNANLLTSALSNLIKNAVIHSHGTAMGVRLVAQSKEFYTFAFWDNGRGVDDANLPHLFDRFFRVDAGRARKTGGTGLGLPIVKNIIESLGGVMSVHNRPNGGLEFMFTLRKSA